MHKCSHSPKSSLSAACLPGTKNFLMNMVNLLGFKFCHHIHRTSMTHASGCIRNHPTYNGPQHLIVGNQSSLVLVHGCKGLVDRLDLVKANAEQVNDLLHVFIVPAGANGASVDASGGCISLHMVDTYSARSSVVFCLFGRDFLEFFSTGITQSPRP